MFCCGSQVWTVHRAESKSHPGCMELTLLEYWEYATQITLCPNLILTYFIITHSMVNDGLEFLLIHVVTHETYIQKFPDVNYVICIRDYVYRKMMVKSKVAHTLLDIIHVFKNLTYSLFLLCTV